MALGFYRFNDSLLDIVFSPSAFFEFRQTRPLCLNAKRVGRQEEQSTPLNWMNYMKWVEKIGQKLDHA